MIQDGYCRCGCGRPTQLAPFNDKSKGWVKGQPLKFIKGHNIGHAGAARSAAAVGHRAISSHGYVVIRTAPGCRQYEHILIAEKTLGRPLRNFGRGHPATEVVHHINGIKTDNRPENLLVCTHEYHVALHHRLELSPAWPEFSERIKHPSGCQRVGASGFKGVERSKGGHWSAHIRADNKKVALGIFHSPEEAARAYDRAALQIHGANWITNQSMGLLT